MLSELQTKETRSDQYADGTRPLFVDVVCVNIAISRGEQRDNGPVKRVRIFDEVIRRVPVLINDMVDPRWFPIQICIFSNHIPKARHIMSSQQHHTDNLCNLHNHQLLLIEGVLLEDANHLEYLKDSK